jgi:transcriptional regulator GlxA family with amidase domain
MGRYPGLVDWLHRMYDRAAVLCSACSGIFLPAEAGIFDGKDARVHFGYAHTSRSHVPNLRSTCLSEANPHQPKRITTHGVGSSHAGQENVRWRW